MRSFFFKRAPTMTVEGKNGDRKVSARRSPSSRSTALYGNLMTFIIYIPVAPVHLWKAMAVSIDDSQYTAAWWVAYGFLWSGLLSTLAVLYRKPWMASVVLSSNTCSLCLMNVLRWPCQDEQGLVPQLLFVYMCIQANLDVKWTVKLAQTAFVYLAGCAVLLRAASLAEVEVEDTNTDDKYTSLLLWFGGATVAQVGLLIGSHLRTDWIHAFWTVHVARWVLAAIFVSNVLSEIMNIADSPEYASQGSTAILKAGLLAAVGLVAAGVFSQQIESHSLLEQLVRQRTQKIQQQAAQLQMVTLALEASDTALAITDIYQRIVWSNPAWQRLANKAARRSSSSSSSNTSKSPSPFGSSLVENLRLSPSDAETLGEAFGGTKCCKGTHAQSVSPKNNKPEIRVGTSIMNVEVSPFPHPQCRQDNGIGGDGLQQKSYPTKKKNCDLPPAVPLGDDECRYVVVFRDVTAERARERAELAAERQNLHVKAMTESIEVVSHELRTPMQCTMGITSMLLQDPLLPQALHEPVSLVMASSVLLLTLINNMLDVRKAESNMMKEFQLKPVDAVPPIQDAVNFCRTLATTSNVSLEVSLARHVVVQSDPLREQQILINLISNSIKHTPSGGTIRVQSKVCTCRQVEEWVKAALAAGDEDDHSFDSGRKNDRVLVISVSDEGSGIAPGQEGKLFRKFSQLDGDSTKNKLGGHSVGQPSGTGLGLNLARRFVHLMHGHIWVTNNESNVGGCTFSFALPLVSDSSQSENAPPIPPLQTTNNDVASLSPSRSPTLRPVQIQSPKAAKYRVLVVDDILMNRKVLDRMLNQIGVEAVRTVESGQRALEVLQTENFNLVISDIQMPNMSGWQLSDRIRRDNKISPKPLVVGLTADTSVTVRERCAASGMVDVLFKPVTVMEMCDYFENTADTLIAQRPS